MGSIDRKSSALSLALPDVRHKQWRAPKRVTRKGVEDCVDGSLYVEKSLRDPADRRDSSKSQASSAENHEIKMRL